MSLCSGGRIRKTFGRKKEESIYREEDILTSDAGV